MAGLMRRAGGVLNSKGPTNGCSILTNGSIRAASGLMRNGQLRSLLVPRSKLIKTSLDPPLLNPHYKPNLKNLMRRIEEEQGFASNRTGSSF